jgi:hypothetical protein
MKKRCIGVYMRLYICLLVSLLFLTGCGGGGGESSDSGRELPTQNYSGVSYSMWDYIKPLKQLNANSQNNSTFLISANSVTEVPNSVIDEKIVYENLTNSIKVTFFKDNVEGLSYHLKKDVKIGETTTVNDSGCMLADHFNSVVLDGTTYTDVIQINCGKNIGYYQKEYGEIVLDSN